MTAQTTRILKEARPLFWPWCAVALAGALPLVYPVYWVLFMWMIGNLLGIPLLASLPFGNEFQHRTFPLLLSQPVDRMEIWREKLDVTVVAIFSATLVFSLSLGVATRHEFMVSKLFLGLDIIITLASATFWTLFAKSTIGGVVLNIAVSSLLSVMRGTVDSRLRGYLSPGTSASISVAALLCYAGLMLWLGRRALAHFQVTGGAAGDDLLTAGPAVLPGAMAGWFRSRPSGAVLNLFRKEFRLLRPVWLLTLLAALGWSGLTLYGSHHTGKSSGDVELVVASLGLTSILLIAILAGSLSLGEEKTSGTYSWHLTLPVPALLQWRIKLYVALFAGLVGAGLLPQLIAGRLFGRSGIFVDLSLGAGWLAAVLLLTFAAFWCACVVNGTVRAVLWVLPVIIAVGFAAGYGLLAGEKLARLFLSRFDPFANFKLTKEIVSLSSPSQHAVIGFILSNYRWPTWMPSTSSWSARFMIVWGLIMAPTLIVALTQSYRLFQAPTRDSTPLVVRKLSVLATLALLGTLSVSGLAQFVYGARGEMVEPVWTVNRAIENVLADSENRKATQPIQLTMDDLDRALPLPQDMRRLLRNTRTTVTLDKETPEFSYRGVWGLHTIWYYDATIHFPSGQEVILSWKPRQISMRIHLPGVPGSESLLGPR